jgi:hypothetical protein
MFNEALESVARVLKFVLVAVVAAVISGNVMSESDVCEIKSNSRAEGWNFIVGPVAYSK